MRIKRHGFDDNFFEPRLLSRQKRGVCCIKACGRSSSTRKLLQQKQRAEQGKYKVH